jgi:hypothetical protein
MTLDQALDKLESGTASASEIAEARKTIEDAFEKQKKDLLKYEKGISREKGSQSDAQWRIFKSTEETKNVLVYVAGIHKQIVADTATYLMNTRKQWEYSQGIAKEFKLLSRDMGLGSQQSKMMADNFKAAMPYVAKMGLEASDLREIVSAFADDSGRIKLFSPEEIENMVDLVVGIGMTESSVGKLAERFDLMGVSVERMYDNLSNVYGDAQKLGLNAKKVMDVMENNFAAMQRMSFKGGTKAMTQMAKLAVEMRMDVSDMLGMADKFYNPEAAIEAAAELQLMGGDIAAAFGDPFEVMYLARNKPEELAQKVADMTENMVTFNEKTGEYDLPAEARQQLTFMADKLGLSKDNVIDMAFHTSKLKDIKEAFDGSNMFDEDEQSAIASMAKFKDGKWQVDFQGKSIPIEDTGAIQNAIQDGMLTTQPDEDPIKSTAKATLTTSEITKNIYEEMKANANKQMDFYTTMEKGLLKPQETMGVIMGEFIKKSGDLLKALPGPVGEFFEKPEDAGEKAGEVLNDALLMLSEGGTTLMTGTGEMIEDLFNTITNKWTEFWDGWTPFPIKDGIAGPSNFSGVLSKPKGSMSAIVQPDENDITFFIQKDKVTKGGAQTVNNNTSSEMKLGGNATLNVVFSGNIPDGMNTKENRDLIAKELVKFGSNNMIADGNKLPQEGGVNALQSR